MIGVKTICVVSLLTGAVAVNAGEFDRPNLLLIVTDDQGYWDLGWAGNEHIDTPTMDRLAQEGVTLTHFYVGCVCAPTRAALMTGRHYLRTGLYNTRFGGDTLGKGETTVAELLRKAGYRTGLFGKWHLGKYAGYRPHERGFDEFLGHYHGHIERYDYADQLVHNGRPVETRGYVTDLFTDAALEFTPARTPTANVFVTHTLGVVNLHQGPAKLKAEAVQTLGGELMRLNRIWIKRLGD